MTDSDAAATQSALRREGGRVAAVLARALGDIQLAEDAFQDAAVSALEVWPRTGVPANPGGWLYSAARRKALDVLRRESSRPHRESKAALTDDLPSELPNTPGPDDDQLQLLLTCCHPSLANDAQVALALRCLCPLSTAEVARVLLVSEPTIAKRLTRAKTKLRLAGIRLDVPPDDQLAARVGAVAVVLHLLFTAGHSATGSESAIREDLCDEAIRATRALRDWAEHRTSLGAEQLGSIEGLLALLLLTEARRRGRVGATGAIVRLAEADRSTWDRTLIEEGCGVLDASLRRTEGRADPFQLQAAIAACHSTAPDWATTDHKEILRLYELLMPLQPGPAVVVNAAVARLEVDGPDATLAALDQVEPEQRSDAWFLAAAEAHRRRGDAAAAVLAFDAAGRVAPNAAVARHIAEQRAQLQQ